MCAAESTTCVIGAVRHARYKRHKTELTRTPVSSRAIPELAASLGMPEGELFGLAEEDLDLDQEKIGRARYVTTRREGIHQLLHYFASVMLAGGVSIKELAEYLGHSDPAFTLRYYAHMLPCSHDRARAVITDRFTRMMGNPDA